MLIVDGKGRIILILLGCPEDSKWDEVVADAVASMIKARIQGEALSAFTEKDHAHRGHYLPITAGDSLGLGQKVTKRLFICATLELRA
jgi:hypothetical protein